MAAAPVVLGAGGLVWMAARPRAAPMTSTPGQRRERRATLEPALYTGKARRAHEVAREIPDVLDALHCYCGCDGIGHLSLLTCYVDGHAAT